MKKKLLLICIAVCLLIGVISPVGGVADDKHPITMTITVDPDPELEEGGTIPDLLFTIRNTGSTDYTLEDATLSGGYENRELTLEDSRITVLADGTKEFHLYDVPVTDEQLDKEIVYELAWNETVTTFDDAEGSVTTIYSRETRAGVTVARFVLPELSVSARTKNTLVRDGETFTVVYTVKNDTKFDMSGLKLYDPEQSMQRIELPSADLFAGESRSIEITYTMGREDMHFKPVIEYIARQR